MVAAGTEFQRSSLAFADVIVKRLQGTREELQETREELQGTREEHSRDVVQLTAKYDLEKRKANFWRDVSRGKDRAEALTKYGLSEEDVRASDSDDDS
jgi:hypothetical protein